MQLSIFDLGDSKDKIIESLKNYKIDEIYRKKFIKGKTYTFLEIYRELSKNNKFTEYLKELSKVLSYFIKKTEDAYGDFINNTSENTFSLRADCIIVYNFNQKSVGPIYCAEMLSEEILWDI